MPSSTISRRRPPGDRRSDSGPVVTVASVEAGGRMASCSACPGFWIYRAGGGHVGEVDELATIHRHSHAYDGADHEADHDAPDAGGRDPSNIRRVAARARTGQLGGAHIEERLYYPAGCPPDHMSALEFEVKVRYRGRGKWSVEAGRRQLSQSGRWLLCPLKMTELRWCRFDFKTACRLAEQYVNTRKINGKTWAEWQDDAA
jgi:hypothetical protein